MKNFNSSFTDTTNITITGQAFISPGCILVTTNHFVDPVERVQGLFDNRPDPDWR